MSVTSKSPKSVLLYAMLVAEKAFPRYCHKNSPKKFTQQQLFACLVLKSFLRLDYRGVAAHLSDCPDLQNAIGLLRVPHFTTIQKAAQRLLLSPFVNRLLERTIQLQMGQRKRVQLAAIDSSGLQATCASPYFVKRRATVNSAWKTMVYHDYPKLAVVADAQTHIILAHQAGKGPRPDVDEFVDLLSVAHKRVSVQTIVADAGYDSESNHQVARQILKIRTVIPAKHGRATTKPARGRYRRLMQVRFDHKTYRRRSQVETVVSMIKRRLGSFLRGKTFYSRCRELHLMVITHNLMILWRIVLFYRAGQDSLIL
jgi:hypothetical protein